MHGVQIRDLEEGRNVLAVDLHHLLDLYAERTTRSRWRASGVWAIGQDSEVAAQELEQLSEAQTTIPGEHLRELAHGVGQVIDGEFAGFEMGCKLPWIVIRAVDSSFYEVFSTEDAVLDKIRASFQKISNCEYAA